VTRQSTKEYLEAIRERYQRVTNERITRWGGESCHRSNPLKSSLIGQPGMGRSLAHENQRDRSHVGEIQV
jgi:hypothetical protein